MFNPSVPVAIQLSGQPFSTPVFDRQALGLTGAITYRLDDVNFTDPTVQIAFALMLSTDGGLTFTQAASGTWTGGPAPKSRSVSHTPPPGSQPTHCQLVCTPNAQVNVGVSQEML